MDEAAVVEKIALSSTSADASLNICLTMASTSLTARFARSFVEAGFDGRTPLHAHTSGLFILIGCGRSLYV